MDFKNKDKVEVSIYLSQAGIPDDICETFESKQPLLCFSWFIFWRDMQQCIHIQYELCYGREVNHFVLKLFGCTCNWGPSAVHR